MKKKKGSHKAVITFRETAKSFVNLYQPSVDLHRKSKEWFLYEMQRWAEMG